MEKRGMNLREIVKQYLEANGFDGLYREGCGCRRDDLFPCDNPTAECQAGCYMTCAECDPDECDYPQWTKTKTFFCIGPDKPLRKEAT